jgi:hypothetical protein
MRIRITENIFITYEVLSKYMIINNDPRVWKNVSVLKGTEFDVVDNCIEIEGKHFPLRMFKYEVISHI